MVECAKQEAQLSPRNRASTAHYTLEVRQWLKWKSRGRGTVPAHLGPLSVHVGFVGPLLTVVPPR